MHRRSTFRICRVAVPLESPFRSHLSYHSFHRFIVGALFIISDQIDRDMTN